MKRKTEQEWLCELKEVHPNIDFISKNGRTVTFKCLECGHEGTADAFNMRRGHGCRKCMGAKLRKGFARTQEECVELLLEKAGSTYHLQEQYTNNATPVAIYHDICKQTFRKRFGNPLHEKMCPFCYGVKQTWVGVNDLWTTHPDRAVLLANPEDGYKLRSQSHKKVDAVCPYCGKVSAKWVSQIDPDNFSCPYCSFTYSYPERVVMSLLEQLNVDFIHDSTTEWSLGKRYDFIIKNDIVCETHGVQHYDNNAQFAGKSCYETVVKNDVFKKELALKNGIKHYVEIDCRVSAFEFIKNNILKSELSRLFNLNYIDWEKCKRDCTSKRTYRVIEMFKNNISIKDIAKSEGIHRCTVTEILKRGTKDGLCLYDPQQTLSKSWFKSKDKRLSWARLFLF